MHDAHVLEPVDAEYFPGAHIAQLDAPISDVKLPTVQDAHVEADDEEYQPVVHDTQVIAAEAPVATDAVPPTHAVHKGEPLAGW